MHLQNVIKIHQLVHKILSINEISTSIKGHNSVEIIQIYIYNAYTEFDRNPQINSQDIEHKQKSEVDQGP